MRLSILVGCPTKHTIAIQLFQWTYPFGALSILNLYAYFRFFHNIKDKATLTIDLMSISWFVKQILTEKEKEKEL
ncbi:unnamed protein product [Prunus brigantina]